MQVLVITGMSGAGKSTALKALEDLDFFCVDNMPLPLAGKLIELFDDPKRTQKIGMVIDAREKVFLNDQAKVFGELRESGYPIEILYLDANDSRLLRRFSETRRRHPLSGEDLRQGIEQERELLQGMRQSADAVMDTSNLTVHQLKGIIQERYGAASGRLSATLLSFGFKYGLPTEADLVFDVRFLPNPYFVEELSAHSGLEGPVQEYVLERDETREFLDTVAKLLHFLLPRYESEGKSYLTIAIGCTGGRHRSVAISEHFHKLFKDDWDIAVRHRDLRRAEGGAPQ